jgi:hypothetical protein
MPQGFAEELLRLCERAYEIEVAKKEEMEKKAQYYLAIITGILGILAFKGDIFNLGDHANVGVILTERGWFGSGLTITSAHLHHCLFVLCCDGPISPQVR